MKKIRIALSAIVVLLVSAVSYGQTVTGSISGTVADPSGAVIGGAKVTLMNELTNQSREQDTGTSGDFNFTEIVPGTYDVSVTKDGFKTYSQKAIVVATSENVALHQISLEIGSVTQEVTVSAATARIETDNGQRTALVTTTQMDTMPNSGLNYLSTLQVLPGVQGSTIEGGRIGQAVVQLDGIGFEDNGVQGEGGNYTPNLEAIGEIKVMLSNFDAEYGTRAGGQINVSSKAGTNQFHGSGYWFGKNTWFDSRNYFSTTRAIDRFNNPGYTIGGPIFIPKTNFDKSRNRLFFFWAQEWLPSSGGGTPSYLRVPTLAERNGDFSQDVESSPGSGTLGCTPYSTSNGTGDPTCGSYVGAPANAPVSLFCPGQQPVNQQNAKPPVFTDVTLAQAKNFPASCGFSIYGASQYYMNALLPLPNYCSEASTLTLCNTNKANDSYVTTSHTSHNQEQARIDYAINSNTTFFIRGIRDYQLPITKSDTNQTCENATMTGTHPCLWPTLPGYSKTVSYGLVGTLTHVFTTNIVNDLTAGFNLNFQNFSPPISSIATGSLSTLGMTTIGVNALPEFLPAVNNTEGVALAPYAFFSDGSFSGAPSFVGNDLRYPFIGRQDVRNLTDNLSWVHGQHSLKAGLYLELGRRYGKRESYFNGAYSFSNDSTDPDNTNFSYANALIGIVTTNTSNTNGAIPTTGGYEQSNQRLASHGRYHDLEWYLQDDWKVTRRLTINPGVRFQHITPTWSQGDIQNNWLPNLVPSVSTLDPLIAPGCSVIVSSGPCPKQDRVGINPLTGAQVSPGLIGDYAPTSQVTGAACQGVVKQCIFPGTKAFPASTAAINQPSLGIGPRIGFAYDLFGDGKTAFRGGFGMFNDRPVGDDFFNQLLTQAPNFLTYQSSDTNLQTIQSLCCSINNLFLAPQGLQAYQYSWHLPQSYDWSLGGQHDLGNGFLLDVAYAGNVGRHLRMTQNINATNYNTVFQPASIDPTTSSAYTGNYADILRPYPNDGGITYSSFDGTSNYHSLQTQIQRRFSKSLTFTGTWTWSKVMDYGTSWNANVCGSLVLVAPCLPRNGGKVGNTGTTFQGQYGPASTYRKHNIVVNWTYNVPNASQKWDNLVVREALDGWQLAGLVTINAGPPETLSYSIAGNSNPTGAIAGDGLATAVNISPSCLGRLQRHLESGCVSEPAVATAANYQTVPLSGLGNANLRDVFNGPWTNNWNVSLFKHIALGKSETRSIELRMETYNTWNHTQLSFGGSSLQAQFNTSGSNTNNNFLQYTSAAAPRTMQFAIRVLF